MLPTRKILQNNRSVSRHW